MAEITFECPHCRKSVKIGEEYAGRKVICPECPAAVEIPAAACASIWKRFLASVTDWVFILGDVNILPFTCPTPIFKGS